jgi:hypothetical protein
MTLYYVTSDVQSNRCPWEETMLSNKEFRGGLRSLLERSGRSMRGLSAAFGRDPGYVAALLDPTRPSRARPTPDDLLAASDALGIAFVELLEALWGVERSRLGAELHALYRPEAPPELGDLRPEDRDLVEQLVRRLRPQRYRSMPEK